MVKAAADIINQWQALSRFLEDRSLPLDNTRCERALRGVAIGRKNYLFAGTDVGAERAATIYTLIRTCALVGADPLAYFRRASQARDRTLPRFPNRRDPPARLVRERSRERARTAVALSRGFFEIRRLRIERYRLPQRPARSPRRCRNTISPASPVVFTGRLRCTESDLSLDIEVCFRLQDAEREARAWSTVSALLRQRPWSSAIFGHVISNVVTQCSAFVLPALRPIDHSNACASCRFRKDRDYFSELLQTQPERSHWQSAAVTVAPQF